MEPKEVRLTPEGVIIKWDDGETCLYPHRLLRLQCRCAGCIGEWPRRGTLDPATVPQDVRALDYMPVGKYALQFLWSDGHYTGIYPYQLLRKLCPSPSTPPGGG